MQVIETKAQDPLTRPPLTRQPRTRGGKGRVASQRAPVWRPQPSGLTRAELRQIVLDTLG